MSDINVTGAISTYSNYQSIKPERKSESGKVNPGKNEGNAAVYEKTEVKKPVTYSINKLSAEDRKALVAQLKQDQENRMAQLTELVSKMMTGQATTFAKTDESMWRFLASGKFTVDAATKAQAKEDISENGYWGVKQTSQRLFDFACALAGDDVEKMKEMQAAMEKGFKMATKTWGKELPGICRDTIDAANKLFEDYYASKGESVSTDTESGLSKKAQNYLNRLRNQYRDYDFMIGGSSDDLQALSKSGTKEFSVIFTPEEIERMASDENYAKEKMKDVEGAVNMSKRICEQEGYVSAFDAVKAANGTLNRISIAVGDDGIMKMFAELERVNEEDKQADTKKITVEASTMEDLIEKIRNAEWNM